MAYGPAITSILASASASRTKVAAVAEIGDVVVCLVGASTRQARARIVDAGAAHGRRVQLGDAAALPAALKERDQLVQMLVWRSQAAAKAGRMAASDALSKAAFELGDYSPRVTADGSIDLYDLYSRAFDLVVGVRSMVDADPLLTRINQLVAEPMPYTDAQGNRRPKVVNGRIYAVSPPSEGDPQFGNIPMAWYARHVAFGLLAAGNPDHQDPVTSTALTDLAARIVREWVPRPGYGSKVDILTFFDVVLAALPANAGWSRRWIETQHGITNWHKASTTEIVRKGVENAVKSTRDAIEPPGGVGVGLLVVAVVVAGVATWRKT